jgi:hypothetical protein
MLGSSNTDTSFIEFLIAYIGIFSNGNFYSFFNPWRPAYWACQVFFASPMFLYFFFYHIFVPPTYLLVSRARKSLSRLRRPVDLPILELTRYKASDRPFNMSESKLLNVLFIEHLLLSVVDTLHYDDVVNLSMICRAAREAVFPQNDMAMRVPKLMAISCETDVSPKKTCLYCNKMICSVSAAIAQCQ